MKYFCRKITQFRKLFIPSLGTAQIGGQKYKDLVSHKIGFIFSKESGGTSLIPMSNKNDKLPLNNAILADNISYNNKAY